MREYIYIPLGGNRRSEYRTITNLVLTFIICGIWHGAGWTFIIWGALHGAAIVIHRLWKMTNISLNNILAWFITFNFINIAWVFFRAKSVSDAVALLKGMLGMRGLSLADIRQNLTFVQNYSFPVLPWLQHINGNAVLIAMNIFYTVIVLFFRNSNEITAEFNPNVKYAVYSSLLLVASLLSMLTTTSNFIYFNF
jgi:hypothetical protein